MNDEEKFKDLLEGQLIEITKEQLITQLKKAREEEAREIYTEFQRLYDTEATMWFKFFTDYMEEKLKGDNKT